MLDLEKGLSMDYSEIPMPGEGGLSTADEEYALRLQFLSRQRYKKILRSVNPYRLHIRKICVGRVLDIGCGIGRNLGYLSRPDALGIDHNTVAITLAQAAGFTTLTPTQYELEQEKYMESFDTLLISHVLEHLTESESISLLSSYLPAVKTGGRVIVICPQERGQASDPTHRTFLDHEAISLLFDTSGVSQIKHGSFPFPSWFGRFYVYNETVVMGVKQ
jgi:SAM-dependent methyltransferase